MSPLVWRGSLEDDPLPSCARVSSMFTHPGQRIHRRHDARGDHGQDHVRRGLPPARRRRPAGQQGAPRTCQHLRASPLGRSLGDRDGQVLRLVHDHTGEVPVPLLETVEVGQGQQEPDQADDRPRRRAEPVRTPVVERGSLRIDTPTSLRRAA